MKNTSSSLPVFLLAACLGLPASGALAETPAPASGTAGKPNVIFFLVDDMGWMDTATYGSTFYRTPNFDRLAKSGVRFTNAYSASPLCSPSRGSILTGQYPARHGITTAAGHAPAPKEPTDYAVQKNPAIDPVLLPRSQYYLAPGQFTVAEAFRDAGYRTGFVGKWHLGLAKEFWPGTQGFEFSFHGAPDPGPPSYFSPYRFKAGTVTDGPPGEFLTDRATDEALGFINKESSKPFFLFLWHWGVHTPFQAKEDLRKFYLDHPDPQGLQKSATMAAMIQSVDESLGRILDDLERTGLDKNTVIIVTSDNGGLTNKNVEADGKVPATNNAPLLRGKASLFEGGTRVPAIVRWPGVTTGGSLSEALLIGVDYYPTLLDIAGIAKNPDQIIDGTSIVPALRGEPFDRGAIYCFFPHSFTEYSPPGAWVREGDWKLIENFWVSDLWAKQYMLYNLKDDIGETVNLAAQNPEIVSRLAAMLKTHYTELCDHPPKPNPLYDSARVPADGWVSAIRGGQLQLSENGLSVLAKGISTRALPREQGNFKLRWTMSSSKPGQGSVFWSDFENRQFSPDRKTAFQGQGDGQPHSYEVAFSVPNALMCIRIDFGTGIEPFEVKSIELLTEDGRSLQTWDFASAPASTPVASP